MNNSLVSVIIRTIGGRSKEIRRAINSISENSWPFREIIIVYQGPENEEWEEIKNLPNEFPRIKIELIQNLGQGDRRAENLNIGWENAKGRYISILDDDDILKPNHFELLIKALISSDKTWVYGQTILRREDENFNVIAETFPFKRKDFSIFQLWEENFIPIHSFIVDRSRLTEGMRYKPFYEELDRSEDWDFLLRLAFYHEPLVVEDFTSIYCVSIGARNTNLSLMNSNQDLEREKINKEAWSRCKNIIAVRQNELIKSVWWSRDLFYGNKIHHGNEPTKISKGFKNRVLKKIIKIIERML